MKPEAGDVWVECDGQEVQGGGGAGDPEGCVVTPGRHQNRGVVTHVTSKQGKCYTCHIKIEEGIKEAVKGALEEVMGGGGIKVPINGQDSLKNSREWEKGKSKEQRQMFKVKLFCREEMVQKDEVFN